MQIFPAIPSTAAAPALQCPEQHSSCSQHSWTAQAALPVPCSPSPPSCAIPSPAAGCYWLSADPEPGNTPGFSQGCLSAGRFLPCSSSCLCAGLCSHPPKAAPCLEHFSSLVLPFVLLQQISSPSHTSFQCKFNVSSINQAINLKLFNASRYKADCYGDSPEISFQ